MSDGPGPSPCRRRPPRADAPWSRCLRGQEGHRRPGSAARAPDRRAAGPRPRPGRGRARPGQDAWRSRRWPSRSAGSSSASSSRPTWCPPTSIGTRIYNQQLGEFQTSLGPVFTNLLLADEINRAPAKVQSALLEVMQERQVTIGRETHQVPEPVPRAGHAEPDRVGGHLPAARGPGRPVHAEGARRLPDADRGVRDRGAHDRDGRAAAPGHRHGAAARAPARGRRGLRRPGADRVRRAPGGRHAGPARGRPAPTSPAT